MIKDDYYSSLPSSDENKISDSQKSWPKLKLKIKKKIVTKPVKEVVETDNTPTVEQTIVVAKNAEVSSSENNDTPLSARPNIAQKREENRNAWNKPRSNFSNSGRSNSGNSSYSRSNTQSSDTPKIKERGSQKPWQKQFNNPDAKPWEKGWLFKKKHDKWSKGKKGKFDKYEEKDKWFVRSNKIAWEKKEKNIEDIKQNLVDRSGETIVISDVLTLKEFSEKIWVPLAWLMAEFMKNGMMVNLNSKVDFDSACIIAEVFNITLERDKWSGANLEDIISKDMSVLLAEDDSSKLVSRSPVVSIMGHVDHGKTSLLDYIRKTKVVDGEAGGITQSIWAYEVEIHDKRITFLDTPGHEAFTIMRARWAKSTDIAILVVAADEWVKPQTIESISHAKEAGIPVVVAVNKMDKQWANPDHIKGQLSEHGLTPEDWGGETPMIPVSAHSWFWIDDLLEVLVLVAEMQELKANPDRLWVATVIESHLDKNLWPVSTVLVNAGTVNVWDNIVCNDSYWKIKVLKNHLNQKVKKAWVSQPALIVGLDKVVGGWDIVQVVQDAETARKKVEEYELYLHNEKDKSAGGLDLLMSKIKSGNLKQLKVVVKADSNGSVEALKAALIKLSTDETEVLVIHSGVGNINLGDILMCEGSNAILIAFWVSTDASATKEIENAKIEFINSKIIYHITERIEKIVTWMLDPKETEVELSQPKVWGIFYTDKKFMIVGLILKEEWESVEKNALIRVLRAWNIVGRWEVKLVKQWVEEVNKVEWPIECWIKFKWDVQLEMGDVLDIYKVVKG
jgi:translation initiation factor IF-2